MSDCIGLFCYLDVTSSVFSFLALYYRVRVAEIVYENVDVQTDRQTGRQIALQVFDLDCAHTLSHI